MTSTNIVMRCDFGLLLQRAARAPGLIAIDRRGLHKQPFDIEHVGGSEGYFAIKDEVRKRVK